MIAIAAIMLAVPLVTWWLESRDPDRQHINRMADQDRRTQAKRLPQRRMRYAQIKRPVLLQQHGMPKGN